MHLMARVQFLVGASNFSMLHSVQTSYGGHTTSYSMGTRGYFSRGIPQIGCEADDSPPPSAEVKNGGVIPPLPHMSSWHSM
jgi:hypothetical protein